MKKQTLILLCLYVTSVFFTQTSFASSPSDSVRTMSMVLNFLNHYPGDDEKTKLEKIINSKKATSQEKIIATAILNLHHGAKDKDKDKLASVISDSSTSGPAKDLAKIVKGLSHKASSSDKAILKKYMW